MLKAIVDWFCQHEWSEWEFHYGHTDGNWETRYCYKCGKAEERDC